MFCLLVCLTYALLEVVLEQRLHQFSPVIHRSVDHLQLPVIVKVHGHGRSVGSIILIPLDAVRAGITGPGEVRPHILDLVGQCYIHVSAEAGVFGVA